MAEPFNAELFGFRSERDRHLVEVRRSLVDMAQAAGRVQDAIDGGRAPSRSDLEVMVVEAARAQARGTALAALDAVPWLVPGASTRDGA